MTLRDVTAGGFTFGYFLSRAAGAPEKAARTNSIEVRCIHSSEAVPLSKQGWCPVEGFRATLNPKPYNTSVLRPCRDLPRQPPPGVSLSFSTPL